LGSSPVTVTVNADDPNLASVRIGAASCAPSGPPKQFACAVTLAEGRNTLVATAVDSLGHQAESQPAVLSLDTLPPVLTIDFADLPQITASTKLAVTGTVSDPHLSLVTVNGAAARVTGSDYVAADVP